MTSDDSRERLLVIGGSGLVGSLIVPGLTDEYRVRILDPRRPDYGPDVEYAAGGSTDPAAVAAAFEGVDVFAYLVMGPKDPAVWELPEYAPLQFDMAVRGLYTVARAAVEAGVRHGVYASSMSVFKKYTLEERLGAGVPDAIDFYGLAKRLGEEVLAARVASDDLSAVALRLCLPMSDADWLASEDPLVACIGTAGTDVLTAFRAALRHRGDGFKSAPISGDRHSRYSDLSIADELLGWSPTIVHPLNP